MKSQVSYGSMVGTEPAAGQDRRAITLKAPGSC